MRTIDEANSIFALTKGDFRRHERGAFANPNGEALVELVAAAPASGHAVTAQRSIIPKLRPPPPPVKITAPAPFRSKGKRKSDRLTVVVDPIRTGKRLVHPHLPPPAGYAANYVYDETKQLAKFIVKPPKEDRKRRRSDSSSESDSDDSEEDSDFEIRGKMEKPIPRLLNRRLSLPNRSNGSARSSSARDRLHRRSSLGQRSSARISNNDGLLTRQKIFAALQDLMSESGSSDLSSGEDGSESDSEESESDFRSGRKILAGQEEIKREGSEDHAPTQLSSPLSAPFLPDSKPFPSPSSPSSSSLPPRRILPTPSTASPPSSDPAVDAPTNSTSSSSQSNRNRRSSRNNDDSSLSGPSGSSTGSSSDLPAKQGGGDSAGDEDGNEKRKVVVDVNDMDIEPEELKEEEDEDTCLKDRNEDEREAVALMLLLGRPLDSSTASASPKPPSPPLIDTPLARQISRESSLSSVNATPPFQPIPSTSAARLSSDLDEDDSATPNKRRGRPPGVLARHSLPVAARPVRSVRTKQKAPDSPPPLSKASTSAAARQRRIANGTEQKKRGRPPGAVAHSPSPSSILTRPTRANNPIADPMKDFLQSTRVTSVIGGYDSVRRRYFACEPDHPESPPTPYTDTSLETDTKEEAEEELEVEVEVEMKRAPRGTRSSQPIKGDISSIISSKEALRLTGGYDEELGKYVGRRSL